jgi:2-dehydro-3-deoxy-D-arabinonate dehydratase
VHERLHHLRKRPPIDIVNGSLIRIATPAGPRWRTRSGSGDAELDVSLADLLALPLDQARRLVDAAHPVPSDDARILAPIDGQEVWASGVTYERSRAGRVEEAQDGTIYDRVYEADRPELFFKSSAARVVGPGDPVGIRADSDWNAPEAEITLVLNSAGDVFGYVIGNDMSSRSIEGENPLYLPQAKVYDRACALGPAILPAWLAPPVFAIEMVIERAGATVFSGTTNSTAIHRPLTGLAEWLFAALDFPTGAFLLTGTGIVPDEDVTLEAGDTVRIVIEGLGTLENPVTVVGRDLRNTAREDA